jgi:tight adherence protein B
MTVSLLCLALALLSWPPAGGARRGTAGVSLPRPAATPMLVGCATAVLVAVVSTPLVGCLAGSCAGVAVRARLAGRRSASAEVALVALADVLGALAAELRSGRPVEGAIEVALAACGDEECRRAVGPALRAAARGGTPPDAGSPGPVADATERVAAAVRLSARTGCSLAAVLAAVEDDLRARHRQAVEARTATAGPRASAMLLAGLPMLALAMGGGIGADPWRVLTTTAAGQVLLVAGVLLELIGVSWSGRLVRRALR